jgi:hypothetical protein
MTNYVIDTTRTMLDAFPGNHVVVDGDRIAAICPIWPGGADSAALTIQRAVNCHDDLITTITEAEEGIREAVRIMDLMGRGQDARNLAIYGNNLRAALAKAKGDAS